MLTPNGDVCLIDFNAALVGANDTVLISRSLGYASPEQFEAFQKLEDARSTQGKLLPPPLPHKPGSIYAESRYADTDSKTELTENSDASLNTQFSKLSPSQPRGIDWKRSDIYSLGATMYHLLSGRHPPERAEEVIALSKLGHYGEGIRYVVERSMRIDPSTRIASALALTQALRSISGSDSGKKRSQAKNVAIIASISVIAALLPRLMRDIP